MCRITFFYVDLELQPLNQLLLRLHIHISIVWPSLPLIIVQSKERSRVSVTNQKDVSPDLPRAAIDCDEPRRELKEHA